MVRISFIKLKRIECCMLPYSVPSGCSVNLTAKDETPSLPMGWTDRWYGQSIKRVHFFNIKIYHTQIYLKDIPDIFAFVFIFLSVGELPQ